MLKPYFDVKQVEAGCDEAGRGCLAGPVTAAAVILPKNWRHPVLNDSKQLSKKQREQLRIDIESQALAWAVAFVDETQIDQINILKASFLAMDMAVEMLNIQPNFLLIDGNRFKSSLNIPFACIVKGDAIYASIAAASVLAKTYRDDFMAQIHNDFPIYDWQQNKGYPTVKHRNAVKQYGLSPYHRKSFHLKEMQRDLFNGK